MKRVILTLFFCCCLVTYADAASRFWVGGTGTWDNSSTTHWSATTGGASGASAPTTGDVVTFDSASGGGTVTVNLSPTLSLDSMAIATFAGTWDNSVNNNNFTFTGANVFTANGTGVRTIKLGSATYTFATVLAFNFAWNPTNLTLQASNSTLIFSGAASAGNRQFSTSTLTWGTVTFGAMLSGGRFQITSSTTITTFNLTAPNFLVVVGGTTFTITNPINFVGTSAVQGQIGVATQILNSTATMALAATSSVKWTSFRDIVVTGTTLTGTNSMNGGNNSGISFTPPVFSGGGCILGGWLLWRDMPEHMNDNFPAWLEKEG